ncbi:MAG: Ku protein [Hyphomicrobiaceae bacterium]|jgi:DNA end-binding protein Ku|nr:Ku protein [Hyphomicrobiaceae bacterium]
MPKKSARAYWKGFLRLSLVSIGVEVYNAVESKSEISFRQIHKPSGRRINYEKVVQGIGKIDNADIVKGYEVDTDTYVTLEPEEIDALKLESKKTIDLVQFVDADDIDYRYFERPYFVVPQDEMSGEGYVVIRDALRKTNKVGLAQVTISGREWLVAIAPLEDGLVMEMLRYADELRQPEDYFDEIPTAKPDKEMVDLAVQLITKKSSAFAADKYEDHYQTALKQLVQDKVKGRKIIAPHEETRPKGTNVVDLMAALKKSVGEAGGGKKAAAAEPAAKAPAKKAAPKSKKKAS